jgi:phage tail tape-measure protein
MLMKILFIPFSIIGGFIGGFLGKKLFEQVWGLIDDEEPPEPKHRRASLGKVVAAAAIEGAIFKGTRAAIDHESRKAFASATGSWPGEERPEKE